MSADDLLTKSGIWQLVKSHRRAIAALVVCALTTGAGIAWGYVKGVGDMTGVKESVSVNRDDIRENRQDMKDFRDFMGRAMEKLDTIQDNQRAIQAGLKDLRRDVGFP